MGQVGAHQDHIARFEMADTVTQELRARALQNMDQFYFGMIMPVIVKIRNHIVPDAEGVFRPQGYF